MRSIQKGVITIIISLSFYVSNLSANVEEHLSNYGVSMQVAKNFLLNNYLINLELVFNTCKTYEVTNSMIAEILQDDIPGLTEETVLNYFNNNGFDGEELDNIINQNQDTNTTYTIVDTAQTTCYDSTTGIETTCNGTGYDGGYSNNQPSYTLSSSGNIVSDNITSLMWTQSTDLDGDGNTTDVEDKRSYDDAVDYCSSLSLDEYDDWRLPDIKTLYSLIKFNGLDASSYLGSDTSGLTTFLDSSFTKAFGEQDEGERIIDAQYATTTKYVSTTMYGDDTMFGVNFVDGRIKGYPTYKNLTQTDNTFYTLCVRGNESYGQNDFVDNNDKTITDEATSLMWEKDDFQSSDFEDAISTCEASNTADYTDWKLPSVKELQSIIDYSRSPDTTLSAAIDPIFNITSLINEEGETDWGYYWSSTTHLDDTANGIAASYVSFGRALGVMNSDVLDVHGAGAQRSNDKQTENSKGATTQIASDSSTYYIKGPQGDILRIDNMARCVRNTK